jgi:alpha-beta hydrolase superfamily lysophospholipase
VQGNLSQDKDVIKRYNSDPLVHDKISVSLAYNAMRAASYALSNSQELEVPLLLMHGSQDLICSPEGCSEFAAGTKRAELKIWDGGYHELHNEPFKNNVLEYIISWITRILTGSL